MIVAGDVTMDWHLARVRERPVSGMAWNGADRAEVYVRPGGAALTAGLMSAVAATLAGDGSAVEVFGPGASPELIAPGDPRFHHSFASWSRYPRRRGDRDCSVWRVEESLGLDRARTAETAALVNGGRPGNEEEPAEADLVILDDAALGFRASPGSWPAMLRLRDGVASEDTARQPWVVVKMTSPVASGELWQQLLRLHARRLIAVMTLDDLRLSDVKISRELSWERIAGDLVRGLVRQPAVNSLLDCAHVVVSLGTGGALLLSRPRTPDVRPGRLCPPDCQVFFDPESIETAGPSSTQAP